MTHPTRVAGMREAFLKAARAVAHRHLRVARAGALLLLAALGAHAWGSEYHYRPLGLADIPPESTVDPSHTAGLDWLDQADIRRTRERLRTQLRAQSPRETYIVVDAANNRLSLRRGDTLVLNTACSVGSGFLLRESEDGRSWRFDTPKGAFVVRTKVRNPVWKKPDWAYVEERKPVPADPRDRFESGVLGEYALYLGDGYMIHGTLYERLLGRSVTHGCIRLGRDDLRTVYATARIGTSVYIY